MTATGAGTAAAELALAELRGTPAELEATSARRLALWAPKSFLTLPESTADQKAITHVSLPSFSRSLSQSLQYEQEIPEASTQSAAALDTASHHAASLASLGPRRKDPVDRLCLTSAAKSFLLALHASFAVLSVHCDAGTTRVR